MRPAKTSPLRSLISIIVRKWQFQIKLSPTSRRGHHNSIEEYQIHQPRIDLDQKLRGEEKRVTKSLVGHSSILPVVKETWIKAKHQSLIRIAHSISRINSTQQHLLPEIWRKSRREAIKDTWGPARKSKLPAIRCSPKSQASCRLSQILKEQTAQNRKAPKWPYKRWWTWQETPLPQNTKKQRANTSSVNLLFRTIITQLRELGQWICMGSSLLGMWWALATRRNDRIIR